MFLQQYVGYYQKTGDYSTLAQLTMSTNCNLTGSYIGSGNYSAGASPFQNQSQKTSDTTWIVLGSICGLIILVTLWCMFNGKCKKDTDKEEAE